MTRAWVAQKLVDGTRVRLMFDNDDWYPGKIIGYDSHTARYRLVFEDGEEVEARHALFEPDDGFFLDNGKDCGMVFRASASASCRAALAAEQDADKDRWRAPRPGEEDGGEWMVGRRIRVFWSFDNKFHEAVVEEYDPDAHAVDSRRCGRRHGDWLWAAARSLNGGVLRRAGEVPPLFVVVAVARVTRPMANIELVAGCPPAPS